jgi:hypothetical protein
MDKRKRGSRWVFISGILIIVLGLIHMAATPLIDQTLFSQLDPPSAQAFLYMWCVSCFRRAAHPVCIPRAKDFRALGLGDCIIGGRVCSHPGHWGSSCYA